MTVDRRRGEGLHARSVHLLAGPEHGGAVSPSAPEDNSFQPKIASDARSPALCQGHHLRSLCFGESQELFAQASEPVGRFAIHRIKTRPEVSSGTAGQCRSCCNSWHSAEWHLLSKREDLWSNAALAILAVSEFTNSFTKRDRDSAILLSHYRRRRV
jgi:hypothetical protein